MPSKSTAPKQRPGKPKPDALYECEKRLQCVVDLASDYYWEQDHNYRFTLLRRRDASELEQSPLLLLGKTLWDLGDTPVDGTWDDHKRTLAAGHPFFDLVLRREDGGTGERYLSLSGQPIFNDEGKLLGYRGLALDITKKERLRRLERTVTDILSQRETFSDALRAAIGAICESEGWEAGQYWRLDDEDDSMRFDVGWSVSRKVIAEITAEARNLALKPGVGLVGTVWATGQPLWVPDLRKETRMARKDVAKRTGWNSALLSPVFCREQVVGVLDFNARHIRKPDERLLQILRVLGMQIGHAHERAIALERLRDSEEQYSSTVELAAIGISHVATDGRFIHVNQQLCDMLGYARDELVGRTIRDISHPEDVNATDATRAQLHSGQINSLKFEKRYLRKDGTTIWVRITSALRRGTTGTPLYDISVVEDISDRKAAEERILYLATHDEMTALPNRATFSQLLDHAVESAQRRNRQCAVLFIDLDRFKIINDSLGHEAGDILLKEISSRLSTCLRKSDVVARLGGDEFVVLLDELENSGQAASVARKILASVFEPVQIMGQECRVTASIGIASYPRDAGDTLSLMKLADLAMYGAKEDGKNTYQFYSRDRNQISVERLTVEGHLRRALEKGELSLQYQAKIDLRTHRIKGAEALLRWWNHELGTVPPSRFIPIAEDTGLIVPIGKWVLRCACERNVAWQRQGLPRIVTSVNLSPRQFRDGNLLNDIAEILEETGLAPELLELEITENMIMSDADKAAEITTAIKRLGVKFAIDDFGTGYSSLSQLKRFPIDTLKVDRSFIRDIPESVQDQAIAKAIISMGKTLGVAVVAEGVETAAQHAFLRAHACDEVQGFYFGKPCHPDAFARLLNDAPRKFPTATEA